MSRRGLLQALVTAVVTVCLLTLPGVLSAQGNREAAFERVREVQERHTDALMTVEGVVGTAVGANENAQHAVLVFLERPGIGGIPKQLDGIPVRPEVTGRLEALARPVKPAPVDPTAWFARPVPIGVSTGHPGITAGTIGCRVVDASGNVYALSNNHVYANENKASLGDWVLQPGPYDGGDDPVDAIGTLEVFIPIAFNGTANYIDAAIALSNTGLLGTATPSGGYGRPSSSTAAAKINMKVKKYGRTTGLTKGKVSAVNAIVNVGYDSGTARFVNQIVVVPGTFSAGGDSGSLIVTESGNMPVGLLFAGSSTATIANPIGAVLSAFNVMIDSSVP